MLHGLEQNTYEVPDIDHHTKKIEDDIRQLDAERIHESPIADIDQLVHTIDETIGFHATELDEFKAFAIKLAMARREIVRKQESADLSKIEPSFVIASSQALRQIDDNRVRDVEALSQLEIYNPEENQAYRCHIDAVPGQDDLRTMTIERCDLVTRKDVADILSKEDFYFDDLDRNAREARITNYFEHHDLVHAGHVLSKTEISVPALLSSIDARLDADVTLRHAVEDALWEDERAEEPKKALIDVDGEIDRLSPITGGLSAVSADPANTTPGVRARTIGVSVDKPAYVSRDDLKEKRHKILEQIHEKKNADARYEHHPDTWSGKIILLGKKAVEQVVDVIHHHAA